MNKTELIDRIAAQADGVSKAQLKQVLEAFQRVVGEALAGGEAVNLTGFGKFEPRRRAARSGRNPQTGQTLAIPAKTLVGFKAHQALADRVNR
jgi:DNA-binding protein HU-beta